tara:strand:- start:13484 stop:14350 length:867 start_codon:yes stop_codon:yes gene_type:complete
MAKSQSVNLTLDTLIEHIARGHAFDKHVLGKDHKPGMQGVNAFNATETKEYFDEKLGRSVPPQSLGKQLFIETPDDLIHYIKENFLLSENTSGYISVFDQSVSLYNSEDNVALHLSLQNKEFDLGTIYRYPFTQDRFAALKGNAQNDADALGKPLPVIDNGQDPKAVMKAISELVSDVNANPQNYLFNKNNPESTVQNRVLSNASRPGRDWVNDEVLHAPNNVKGHSQAYAKANKLDVAPSDYVCIKQASADEFNVGRARKSLRSGRVLNAIKEFGLDSAPEPEPELA